MKNEQDTREQVHETVLTQWSTGASAREIALAVNEEFGGVLPRRLTRSAVCGIVHRAGKSRETGARRSVPKSTKMEPPRPALTTEALPLPAVRRRPASAGAPEGDAPPPRMISLDELQRDTCRWPIGDPRAPDFGFCGHPSGGRYCPHHEHATRRKKADEDADAAQEIAA